MERIGRWARLQPGSYEEYIRWHQHVPQELLRLIRASRIRNYTIFARGLDLFSYLEVDDWRSATEHLRGEPVADAWQRKMAPLMDAKDPVQPWERLDAIFRLD